ncbi:DUF2752 domain-containing protein [Lacinutrix sp. 5H-3-7-4]|uniref:DUF2752 domain-containing protein n=1 Tax=Lacinutrix sp. (strain 5H-3-7-4) TaxID=983544 RepID=UPI00020A339C|nr:DUF2752 domain-containing protein [Lacinutrix sp. 5H-3-7-4]AEH02581.1 hypothetical protein Lacal_2742 [Lacinutrix sp. 5H-3-7-4]
MQNLQEYMLPCLNKKLFGFDCMGCGLQRSLSFLFHGEIIAAFKMYPAIFTLIPLGLLIVTSFFYKFKNINKIINGLAIASVLIIIISFIVKQLI